MFSESVFLSISAGCLKTDMAVATLLLPAGNRGICFCVVLKRTGAHTHRRGKLAIYSLRVNNISRGDGRSSVSAAAYRSGEKIRDERTNLTYDFPEKHRIYGVEILTPENSPEWAKNRSHLWNEVERTEKRSDSRLAKEVRVAIPVELGDLDRIGAVKRFAKACFTKAGQIADIAYHNFAGKGDHNPHAHIMLTTRGIDEKGFGKKNRFWDTKKWIKNIRKGWEKAANWFLEKAGFTQRIDHRRLDEQGIDRIPQIHLGRAVIEMERKGIRTQKGDRYRNIEAVNKARLEVEKAEAELKAIQAQQEVIPARDWTMPFFDTIPDGIDTKTPSKQRGAKPDVKSKFIIDEAQEEIHLGVTDIHEDEIEDEVEESDRFDFEAEI